MSELLSLVEKKKEKLKEEIESITKKIKVNSKDAKFADTLIKELLSKKGQLMIEPTEELIPLAGIVYRHNYGTMEVVQGVDDTKMPLYMFKTKGYRLITRADSMRTTEGANSLFGWLEALCAFQRKEDNKEEMTQQEKDILNALVSTADIICQIPLFGFWDDEFMLDLRKCTDTNLTRILEPMVNADNTVDDDPNALQEMKDGVEFAEALKEV